MKKDLTENFNIEIYSKTPRKNYLTNKKINNHIDELCTFDMADMSDYKISNMKLF